MIKPDDLLKEQNFWIKALVYGAYGCGKTHFASTFEKCYFIITDSGGEDTFLYKPELRSNIVGFVRLLPTSIEDTRRIFGDYGKKNGEFHQAMAEVKELIAKGEVKTVILDSATYFAEQAWLYLNLVGAEYSATTGILNTQAMYGKLARYLHEQVAINFTSLPCNVIITAGELLETEEAMERKVDKTNPIMPSILGGFRNDIAGLVSLVLYLQKTKDVKGYHYMARTNMGSGKNAKSRYPNIPEVVENISYQTLKDVILKSINPVKQEEKKGA